MSVMLVIADNGLGASRNHWGKEEWYRKVRILINTCFHVRTLNIHLTARLLQGVAASISNCPLLNRIVLCLQVHTYVFWKMSGLDIYLAVVHLEPWWAQAFRWM